MRKIFVVLLILGIAYFSYWIGFSLGKEKDVFYKELDIFAESLALIEKKYIEEKNPKDLIYGAVNGLLSSLDAYSEFLSPENYKDLLTETEGKFGGLGIEITLKEGLLTVISPLEDTPAWRAGIKPQDIIVKIDNELTRGMSLNTAVKKMRGEPGTKVTLTILREKDKKIEEITLERAIIKIKDIRRSLILEDGIGYVRIAEFREETPKDLLIALKELKEKGLRGLIIDVRNNPGGLLSSAVEIASLFLEDDKIVVSTRSRTEKVNVFKASLSKEKILDIPLVVLINKGSASGSEILASALRENNRAILLGEKTFGKGSVQTVIPLSDGSALRLTTAHYFTPQGINIHEKGIEPDILVPEAEVSLSKEESVFENLEKKEDYFNYKKDIQILRALDLTKGFLVLKDK